MKQREKKILGRLKDLINKINTKLTMETLQSRKYHECLTSASIIMTFVMENPWHPENDYGEQIFQEIEEEFEKLEKLKLQ